MVTAFENLPADGLPRVPPDIRMANRIFGANCGPVSLAATFGTFVNSVMRFFPEFPKRDYTNAADMSYALERCGAHFTREATANLPRIGVALIQIEGPWSKVPNVALCYTHWVACYGDYVFDLNIGEWLERPEWANAGVQSWLSDVPRASGWSVRESLEITPQQFRFSPYGRVPPRFARRVIRR